MWQKKSNLVFKMHRARVFSCAIGLCVIGVLLAACGGSASSGTSNSASSGPAGPVMGQHAAAQNQAGSSNGSTSGSKSSTSGQYGPQYLVKNLQVAMEVQDTRQSASDLSQWLALADPQATSDGIDYEQTGANQYTVNLTFLVDVAHYDQVEGYLRDYATQHGRTLLSLKESVQDVTNDYVDAQSTLTNLRAEQQRLLNFMNQAQNLNDAVNIEQQLTQVEGQINDIEAHLNALKGQTTFYTIAITLQPVGSAPPPPAQPNAWSVIPIWQGAWSAVVSVWQVLAALLVWLAAFSVYIVPIALIIWLVRKQPWRGPKMPHVMPATTVPHSPGHASSEDEAE
jgi:hypothetical protein